MLGTGSQIHQLSPFTNTINQFVLLVRMSKIDHLGLDGKTSSKNVPFSTIAT